MKFWRQLRQHERIDTLEAELHRAMSKVKSYRAMRQHIRKDGSIKVAYGQPTAQAAATRMTKIHGEQFSAYRCPYPVCEGRWHIGHTPADGPQGETQAASDDLGSLVEFTRTRR